MFAPWSMLQGDCLQDANNAHCAIWWPKLQLMQVVPTGGQVCYKCKWRHAVAKLSPSYRVNFWVRCASGNVFWKAALPYNCSDDFMRNSASSRRLSKLLRNVEMYGVRIVVNPGTPPRRIRGDLRSHQQLVIAISLLVHILLILLFAFILTDQTGIWELGNAIPSTTCHCHLSLRPYFRHPPPSSKLTK